MSGRLAVLAAPQDARAVDIADPLTIASVLRSAGLLSSEAEARARVALQESSERFDVVVTRLGLVSESALAQAVAAAADLPIAAAESFPADLSFAKGLSVPFLRENRALPIVLDENVLIVALVDPFDTFVRQSLEFVFGRKVQLVVARATDIDAAIDRIFGTAGAIATQTDDYIDEDDVERLKDLVSDAPVIRAVNRLIAQAADARASDIHIEPSEDRLMIRFRIDGVLQDRDALPAAMRAPLVSRI